MARSSKIPVLIPDEIKLEIKDSKMIVNGPKGSLERQIPILVRIDMNGNLVKVVNTKDIKASYALSGTIRAHLMNMIKGVTEGWKKTMELVGAGYRAELRGEDLVLNVGYSQPVVVKAPSGIKFSIEKSLIIIEGIDRELVGMIAAKIRDVRKPDPYKGKGIRYQNEIIRKKAGKQAAKTGV